VFVGILNRFSNTFKSFYYDKYFLLVSNYGDRLCGLVVRVSVYRCRDPGSIPGATRLP
jgi:hypothetical protein